MFKAYYNPVLYGIYGKTKFYMGKPKIGKHFRNLAYNETEDIHYKTSSGMESRKTSVVAHTPVVWHGRCGLVTVSVLAG